MFDFGLVGKGPCQICGTAQTTCRGHNEPYVGRPVELAARGGPTMSVIRAKEQIWAKRPDGDAYELLYNPGDPISEVDAKMLGLASESVDAPPKPGPRPKPEPRPGDERVSRDRALADKALRGPREAPKEETDG